MNYPLIYTKFVDLLVKEGETIEDADDVIEAAMYVLKGLPNGLKDGKEFIKSVQDARRTMEEEEQTEYLRLERQALRHLPEYQEGLETGYNWTETYIPGGGTN